MRVKYIWFRFIKLDATSLNLLRASSVTLTAISEMNFKNKFEYNKWVCYMLSNDI